MKFAVLENYNAENQSEAPPSGKAPEPIPKEPEQPEPEQNKIPVERLKGIINNVGINLADDKKMPIKKKIKNWVNILKWALPLIPDDEQAFRNSVQEGIKNPSEWDFMEKPKHY